jgi:hypothetical protein
MLIGWRQNRHDPGLRIALSAAFKILYRSLFAVQIHDPSCPFVLVPKRIVDQLVGRLGVLSQGFWWEFVARAHAQRYSILEIPVRHRPRSAGKTQVYSLRKMPGIGWSHVRGVIKIWREYR